MPNFVRESYIIPETIVKVRSIRFVKGHLSACVSDVVPHFTNPFPLRCTSHNTQSSHLRFPSTMLKTIHGRSQAKIARMETV